MEATSEDRSVASELTKPRLGRSQAVNRERISAWLLKLLKDALKWKPEYEPHFVVFVDACTEYFHVQRQIEEAKASAVRQGEPGLAYMLRSRKGSLYPNPLINHRSMLVNTIRQFGTAFGLNPLAEAKIKATPLEDCGELLKLMVGGLGET
jgi:hypothetical protein